MLRHEGTLSCWIFKHGSADTQPQQAVAWAVPTQKTTEVDCRSGPAVPSPDVTPGNISWPWLQRWRWVQFFFSTSPTSRSFQLTSRRCYLNWHQLVVSAERFDGNQELCVAVPMWKWGPSCSFMQVEPRTTGGTSTESPVLVSMVNHTVLLYCFYSQAQKLLPSGYFPRNHRESALSQSEQGSSPKIPFFPFMVMIWPLQR